ncbi:ABC protein [Daphnia sinensis]|uniref:ABC-type xenobiotic transporter n=1 Tax=Daphnia sinensis TaxID=1820382 RepID=A0AAD5PXN5_9CRUS|nr:ABC protein [Daphnia sinensis]
MQNSSVFISFVMLAACCLLAQAAPQDLGSPIRIAQCRALCLNKFVRNDRHETLCQQDPDCFTRISRLTLHVVTMLRQYRCCSAEGNVEASATSVNFSALFRFATKTDVILMYAAVFAAMLNGVCLPLMVLLWGDLSNVIIEFSDPGVNYTMSEFTNTSECLLPPNATTNGPAFALFTNDSSDIMDSVTVFAIGTMCLALLSVSLNFIFITCLNISAENQIYRLRSCVVKSILAQEISWHDTRTTDGMAVRISEDLTKIQDGIGEKVGLFISYSSIAVSCLITAFYFGWELALITLVALPVLTVTAGILAKIQSTLTAKETEAYASAGSLAEEIIGAIKTVNMFNAQAKEAKQFEASIKPARTAGIKRGLATAIGSGLVWVLTYASYALTFWYGIKLILQSSCNGENTSKYDAGTLNIVFFNMLYAALNVGKLFPFLETFSAARVAAAEVYRILNQIPVIDSSSSAGKRLKNIDGHIKIEDVHFAYFSRPDVPVLRGISFDVTSGRTVALVGQSGCGKSTCIQLLQRFYDPTRGRITIDGHDVKEFNEPVLFSVSIRDNIRYGHPNYEDVSQEDIELAAKQANAHDFIASLPDSYDTLVGERGAHLSGGQKQRIAIARALIRNPKILLFDEATSALDTKSEAVVQSALDKARQGRTTLIVAHRLTTIRNADTILVFNRGVIEEEGDHDTLMNKRGLYYHLVESQQQSVIPDQNMNPPEELGLIHGSLPQLLKAETKVPEKIGDSIQHHLPLQSKDNDVSIWKIFKLNKPEWAYITLGVIGSTILGLSTPVYAMVYGELMGLLDPSLQQEEAQHLNDILALIFLGIAFGTGIGAYMQTIMLTIAGEKLTFRVRKLVFQSILKQKIGWFDQLENSVGSLCARLSGDASAIQGATGARIGLLVQVSVSILFALTLSLVYNWKLALVSGVFVPVVLLSGVLEVKMNTGQIAAKAKALEQSTRLATEAISNIRTVASLGLEEKFSTNYMASLREPYKVAKKLTPVRAVIFGLTCNMSCFASIVCMSYGSYLIQNEDLPYKEVFKICEALVFGMEMVGQTLAFTPNYGRAKTAAKRIFQLIECDSPDEKAANRSSSKSNHLEVEGKVEFRDVHFRYPTRPDVAVLRGLSTVIQPGRTVALVGHSGCGKSTLIQLLQRFYEPDSGTILVDDRDISLSSASLLRSKVGIVSQEPVLFNRTIADNIAYGDLTRSVPMDEIIEAARNANIHNFIQSLPLGYETIAGQRGTQLSGGQKQRLAIARALVRHPRILLLDEATSALDAESEKVVQDALERAGQERTCIIVAHRLSTIKDADEILVVDRGQIREQGKHGELIQLKGIYHQLWTLQGLSQ